MEADCLDEEVIVEIVFFVAKVKPVVEVTGSGQAELQLGSKIVDLKD